MGKIKNIGKSFLILAALTMNLDVQEGAGRLELLFQSLKNLSVLSLILLALFWQLLHRCDEYKRQMRERRTVRIGYQVLAAFFAFCMIFGYSYYKSNDWDLVFGSGLQMIKAGIAFAGYMFLFQALEAIIFYVVDHLDIRADERNTAGIWEKFLEGLRRRPFETAFLICLIAYLPCMLWSWPGIFTCDTKIQLVNGYEALIWGSGSLKNQHPVVHTILLTYAAALGEAFLGGASFGISLLSMAQTLLTICAIAWTVRYLAQCGAAPRWLAAVLAFFILHPRIRNYLFVHVKDVWYAAFLMIFVVEFHRALTERYAEGEGRKKYLPLLLSMSGIFFFRQDAVYVLFLSLLAAAVFKKARRKFFLRLLAGTFLFATVYQRVILPACHVTDENTRQLFSIPFQQTARYLRDAGDDVTAEEAEAIAAVLDYERLGELYNPNLSDPVKATFSREAGAKEIIAYLRAWARMFVRHPDIYIQATMNNLYGYFYPDGYTTEMQDYAGSLEYMQISEDYLKLKLGYPAGLLGWRTRMETLREAFFQLPALSAFNLAAFYIWVLLLLISHEIRKASTDGLLLLTPLFVVFLVCMAGPTSGWYFRYMYAIVVCLPAVLLLNLLENAGKSDAAVS